MMGETLMSSDKKRRSEFENENLIEKKTKHCILDTETGEKVGEYPDCQVEGESLQSLARIQHEISEGEKKDLAKIQNSSSEEELTVLEADAAEDRGSRHSMEDAWVVLPDASLEYPGKLRHGGSPGADHQLLLLLTSMHPKSMKMAVALMQDGYDSDDEMQQKLKQCAHFAIYDGHGGRLAAEYARTHLHSNVLSAGLPRELMDIKSAKKAILEGFRKTDELLLQESAAGGWQDGATAVCVWVLGQTVLVANIGDAKAVLARASGPNGGGASSTLKAIVLTREHKAIYPQERSRIQKAGGSVSNGRLQGRLEVSRAFGDRQFKKVGVIAAPDIHSFELTEREQFMILGCDGLWGVFGAGDATNFVDKLLKEGLSASVVSKRLVKEAVRERRCKDNCTATVIVFKH